MRANFKFHLHCVGLLLLSLAVASAVPVTFRVDMSGAPAFNAGSDVVEVSGSFIGWSSYPLVPSANPNILTNTIDVLSSPGTVEYYKFTWNYNYELQGMGDRRFTQGSGAEVLPLAYLNDLPPVIAATTNSITFRVSMAVQAALGNFDTNADTVSVAGTFQRPAQWMAQAVQLTNSGGYLYVGTCTNDGNYPGTYEEYKFIFTKAGMDTWESSNNRWFILTNNGVLPIVYFNDIGNATPVTFQVDMGLQSALGRFLPGLEVVECKGSFNGWFGFGLTNNLFGPNPNLYSGTTYIYDAVGTPEAYRFTVNGGYSGLGWESPTSTGGRDRTFTLPAGPLTLPLVGWSDSTPADLLPPASSTVVKFTVNMTNAVGTGGYVFDSAFDAVFLNGDWIPWWGWGNYPFEYQMTNAPGSKVYSISLPFPQGYPVMLNYKYSINSFDNEAGLGTNHVRYIRATNSYALPMDTFGQQLQETSFGNLKIGKASGGFVPITWQGRPGVRLQIATNLTPPVGWQNLPATTGLSATNYPVSATRAYFRLFKP